MSGLSYRPYTSHSVNQVCFLIHVIIKVDVCRDIISRATLVLSVEITYADLGYTIIYAIFWITLDKH